MKKRSRYRPRPVNPTAHMAVVLGFQRMSIDDSLRFVALVDAAVDAARQGQATRQQWSDVFGAVNWVEQAVRSGLASDPDGEMVRINSAVADVIERMDRTGSKALRAEELAALRTLAATYADLMASMTQREVYDTAMAAERAVVRALKDPQARPDVRLIRPPKEFLK